MPDHTPKPAFAPLDSRSSLVEKLDPDLRRRLDEALVDRQPATYRATYDQFQLQEKGVSYTAFYYYARRVRVKASLLEMARLTPDSGPHAHELLPEICAQRLLEASLDENASTRLLHRLADIYRIASHTWFARRRLDFLINQARLQDIDQAKRELGELVCDAARLRLRELDAEAVRTAAPSPPSAAANVRVDPTRITDDNVAPPASNSPAHRGSAAADPGHVRAVFSEPVGTFKVKQTGQREWKPLPSRGWRQARKRVLSPVRLGGSSDVRTPPAEHAEHRVRDRLGGSVASAQSLSRRTSGWPTWNGNGLSYSASATGGRRYHAGGIARRSKCLAVSVTHPRTPGRHP